MRSIKKYWINAYLKPPNIIIYKLYTNFTILNFEIKTRFFKTICNQIPIKAYWFLNKIKRNYKLLQKTYEIIKIGYKNII